MRTSARSSHRGRPVAGALCSTSVWLNTGGKTNATTALASREGRRWTSAATTRPVALNHPTACAHRVTGRAWSRRYAS